MSVERVLIILGNSREAAGRANGLTDAFKRVGAEILVVPYSDVDLYKIDAFKPTLILPTSERHIAVVGSLNDRYDIFGVGTMQGAILISKSKTYAALSELGVKCPNTFIPNTVQSILNWEYEGPVFVKPDSSAGSLSPYPWDYRRYENRYVLVEELQQSRAAFVHRQRGNPEFGPSLLQECSESGELHCVTAVMGAKDIHVIAGQKVILDHPDFHFHTAASYPTAPDGIITILKALHRFGYRRQIIYLQTMLINDEYHVIDVNVRFNLNLGMMLYRFMPDIMDDIARCLIKDHPVRPLPDSVYLLRTLYRPDPDGAKAVQSLLHPPMPNNMFPVRMDAAGMIATEHAFDRQMSMPSFILYGDSLPDLIEQADRFEAGVTIHVEQAGQ